MYLTEKNVTTIFRSYTHILVHTKIQQTRIALTKILLSLQSTIVHGGSVIWQRKLGDFGTKICYFIRINMAENGPLVFRTVLYSKYDEKLGNHERKTLR